MVRELSVIGADQVLWHADLTGQLLEHMHEFGLINDRQAAAEGMRRIGAISMGLMHRPLQMTSDMGRGAANRVMDHLSDPVIDEMTRLADEGHELHIVSGAPDFAVKAVVKKLRQETGLPAMPVVAPHYIREHGFHKGRIVMPNVPKVLDEHLAKAHVARFSTGIIHPSLSEERWVRMVRTVITPNQLGDNK